MMCDILFFLFATPNKLRAVFVVAKLNATAENNNSLSCFTPKRKVQHRVDCLPHGKPPWWQCIAKMHHIICDTMSEYVLWMRKCVWWFSSKSLNKLHNQKKERNVLLLRVGVQIVMCGKINTPLQVFYEFLKTKCS